MANLIYEVEDCPKLNSQYMTDFAADLMTRLNYFKEARRPLEQQWRENDRGYFCTQRLPEMDGMQYIYAGKRGETDIHDGVNNLSLRLSLAAMPKDESWLTVVGRMGEPAQLINATQAQQIWMHRKADTRAVAGRHFKQLIVRGSSYYYLRWETETKYRRLGKLQGRRRLKQYLKARNADPSIAKKVDSVRVPTIEFQGPRVRTLDTYDVWNDPEADLICDRRPAQIIATYIRPCDLKAAKDESGDPLYENLENLDARKAHEVYHGSVDGQRRLESLNAMGVRPQQYAGASTDIVPVYTFYFHYIEFDGIEYFDTYFHVADCKSGTPRMIRVEENPSNEGHRLILQDNFIEFFTNVAYGISGVEMLLAAWHQKNFLGALMLNAQAATTFPAYLVASGILKDEMPNLTPGAINEIAAAALQMQEIIRPMPVPERGVQMSYETMDYYKSKIGGGFEVSGAYGSQSQGASNRETATSVNFRATNQGLAIDELSEKFGNTLQNLCQWAYDMNQQTAIPEQNEQGENVVKFGQINGNTVQPGELKFDEWKQPRNIEVLGLHGVANKQQAIMNKKDALGAMGQVSAFLPNAAPLSMALLKALFTDLNVETQDEAWLSPQQLALQDPAVMAMAMEEGLKNPQIVAMVQQKLMQEQGNGQPQPGPGGQGAPPGIGPVQ